MGQVPLASRPLHPPHGVARRRIARASSFLTPKPRTPRRRIAPRCAHGWCQCGRARSSHRCRPPQSAHHSYTRPTAVSICACRSSRGHSDRTRAVVRPALQSLHGEGVPAHVRAVAASPRVAAPWRRPPWRSRALATAAMSPEVVAVFDELSHGAVAVRLRGAGVGELPGIQLGLQRGGERARHLRTVRVRLRLGAVARSA